MYNKKNNVKPILFIAGIIVLVAIVLWLIPNTVLSLDRMINKGEMYQKSGKTALALQVYRKAVDTFPDSAEAHLHLGNALLDANEPEEAKKQFEEAVRLTRDSKNSYDAQVAMSTMLLVDSQFEQAEKTLLTVDDPKPDKVKIKLADLYVKWGDHIYSPATRLDAIEKYKLAFKNYDDVDVEAQQKVEDKVIKVYMDIANDFLTDKKVDQAINILKESQEFVDNPLTHIKLAEIYKKQNKRDDAIAEYEKAYEVDTTGTSALYLGELLVEKGVELAKKNEMDKAKEQFEKAQEVNPSIIIPAEILYSISLASIKTHLIPNTLTDKLYPKVTFQVKNEGKDPVNYLKAKAIYYENGKVVGKAEKVIASDKTPLDVKKTSSLIDLASEMGVPDIKKTHVIQAKIYLAYDKQDDWKFARSLSLSRHKTAFSSSDDKTSKKPPAKPKKEPKKAVSVTKPQKLEDQAHYSHIKPDKKQPSEVTASSSGSFLPDKVAPQPVPLPVPVMVQPEPGKNVQLPPLSNEKEE
jgi:tetratricopeptide (TPR) repeat protein